jgi:methenyltetrahydrofolate cyclohydrolase
MSDASVRSDEGNDRDPVPSVPGPSGSAGVGLSSLTLHEFAVRVGEPLPGAGGGSVSAYAGSLAAALVDMVCRLSANGRDGGSLVDLGPTCAGAEGLRARLLAAVDADAEAYLDVVGAYRLPHATDEESAARAAAIAAATRHAAEVPLASAEACLEVLELAGSLSAGFMTAAASELGIAVLEAMSGIRGAAVNVATNLQHLGADPSADALQRRMAEIERRADEVFAAVWPVISDLTAADAGT